MRLSADAIMLSVQWARLFHPWMWNTRERKWTDKAKDHPLLCNNQEQIQYALNQGLTPDTIRSRMNQARTAGEKVLHVYPLLTKQACGILDSGEGENLLTGSDEYCHPSLFQRNGLIRPTFSFKDLLTYAGTTLPSSPYTAYALRALVREHGLDWVLYAIDATRLAELKLRSPWGLSILKADVEKMMTARRAVQKQARYQIRQLEALAQ